MNRDQVKRRLTRNSILPGTLGNWNGEGAAADTEQLPEPKLEAKRSSLKPEAPPIVRRNSNKLKPEAPPIVRRNSKNRQAGLTRNSLTLEASLDGLEGGVLADDQPLHRRSLSSLSFASSSLTLGANHGVGANHEPDDALGSSTFSNDSLSRTGQPPYTSQPPMAASYPYVKLNLEDSMLQDMNMNLQRDLRSSLLGERPTLQEGEPMERLNGCSLFFFRCRICCRKVVESTCMVLATVLVTIFALVSTDVRDIYTNRPADMYFDYAIIFSMSIFTFEFILSCFGKEDYVLGFFFMLDIISTLSMALDVSYVAYYMSGGDNSLSSARAGRTARLGARAARMVRVIRLFRLVKIYKAIMAHASRPTEEEKEGRAAREGKDETLRAPLKDEAARESRLWERAGISYDDMVAHYQEDSLEALESSASESRVGAKLSELTTRRVITVVMMLMLGLPSLQLDRSQLSPPSMQFGADIVWRAFEAMGTGQGAREEYEFALLNYMFYHNWFTAHESHRGKELSGKFYSHLFWVGMEGNDTSVVFQQSKRAAMRSASVDDFQKRFADQNDLYNYGTMPEEVMTRLGEGWNIQCGDSAWSRIGMSLLQHEIDGDIDFAVECPQDLRPHERLVYHPVMLTAEFFRNYHLVFYFDIRPFVRLESVLSLTECVFVCVMFCFASMVLSHDVTTLVLVPIERMISLMKLIRNDPRLASKLASDEMKNELVNQAIDSQLEKKRLGRLLRYVQRILSCNWGKHEHQSPMETVILEKTIMRLASMLTLGLGEAGLEIIGHSLSGSANAGVIDVFALPTSAVDCIMCVVRTRDFNCAIEVLQEKVVKFVSHIVEIVHGVISEYSGAPNRNNGDSMLLIWRIFADDSEQSYQRLCEMALLSCAKIYAAVQKSVKLMEFAKHPGFQQRLGSDYRVSLTFGLHSGWAIEGAVGSEVKIDATYFSPNVNIAFQIEHATDLYRVPVLVTGSVVQQFSDEVFDKCRLIDRVLIRGSIEPLDIYSLDLDSSALQPERAGPLPMTWNLRTRFLVRQWMDIQKTFMIEGDMPILKFFEEDDDICKLRRRYTEAFINIFSNAYQCYALGEWGAASSRFAQTLTMLGVEDGPSHNLLDYMRHPHNFEAPKSWNGVRKLDLGETEASRPVPNVCAI